MTNRLARFLESCPGIGMTVITAPRLAKAEGSAMFVGLDEAESINAPSR